MTGRGDVLGDAGHEIRQGGRVADGLEVFAAVDARLGELLELGVGQALGLQDVLLERAEPFGGHGFLQSWLSNSTLPRRNRQRGLQKNRPPSGGRAALARIRAID
jgi:hypothetical protein